MVRFQPGVPFLFQCHTFMVKYTTTLNQMVGCVMKLILEFIIELLKQIFFAKDTVPSSDEQYEELIKNTQFEDNELIEEDAFPPQTERPIELIVVHCSATDDPETNNFEAVKELHTGDTSEKMKWGTYGEISKRGWSDIGYHYFIETDGSIKAGRPESRVGAHVRGHNLYTLGVCVAGNKVFTKEQKHTLKVFLQKKIKDYHLSKDKVKPHSYFDKNKTCPNLRIPEL